MAETDLLSKAEICEIVDDDFCRLTVFDTVDSTNLAAKKAALDGAPEGSVFLSAHQTAGRGRLGRSFFSPPGSGLYMSFLLRPTCSPEDASLLTPMAAVCVCQAIEQITGLCPGIKWVNDLFLDGKKICGILTEAGFQPGEKSLSYVILGIGLNVYPPEGGFPPEVKNIAGALQSDKIPGLLNILAARIIRHVLDAARSFPEPTLAEEYKSRCFVLDKDIRILQNGTDRPAHVLDIDDRCRLLVKTPEGNTELLSAGEISIRV